MKQRRSGWQIAGILGVVAAAVAVAGLSRGPLRAADASPTEDPKVWQALLADADIQTLLEGQFTVLDKSLKSNGTFRRAMKKLKSAGQMVAVIGNIQLMRLEGADAQKGAALRQAGLDLAKAADDKSFEAAQKAAEVIKSYPDKIQGVEGKPTPWKELIDLDGVMHGVSTADSETKGAVESSEGDFKKVAKEAESSALLLSALGLITHDYEPDDDWKQWSLEMRDTGREFAKALAKRDHGASKTTRENMMKSCDACHEVYREEEEK